MDSMAAGSSLFKQAFTGFSEPAGGQLQVLYTGLLILAINSILNYLTKPPS